VQNSRITYLGEYPTVPVLSDSALALGIRYMKVTRRYPETGRPASIDVELQTDRNAGYFLRYPVSTIFCPNAKVVARDPNTHQVLGSAQVSTSTFNNCIGTGRIPLNFNTLAKIPDSIVVEAYEDTVDVNHIDSYTPLSSISVPIGVGYQQGLQTGVYSQPTTTSNLLSGLLGPNSIRNISIFVGIGVGGYLVVKNGDTIKKFVTELAR